MISFMDADDNPLLVRLTPERMQLAVIDSRPVLEGGELRGFASALFREYVGPPLAERLAEAAGRLAALEAVGGLAAAQVEQIAAARQAIEAVQGALCEAGAAGGGAIAGQRAVDAPPVVRGPAWLAPELDAAASEPAGRRRRKPRTFRASEGSLLDWGWTRVAA